MTATELEYFTVSGYFFDVQQPLAGGTTAQPQLSVISGYVTFTPRLPATVYVNDLDIGNNVGEDSALAVTPIVGQISGGQLCSINISATPGVELLSNTANLGLAAQGISSLVYDVAFSNVVYAHKGATLANFAFIAPTDTTPVNITDPDLQRLAPLTGALDSFTVDTVTGPTKLVTGVPTDSDFLVAPPDGTLATDTNDAQLYVRLGGSWIPSVTLVVTGPTKLVNGVPTDSAFVTTPPDGTLATNANDAQLYIRINGTWTRTTDLNALSVLTPNESDFLQFKSGAWTNRSIAQVKADLGVANVSSTDPRFGVYAEPAPSGTGPFTITHNLGTQALLPAILVENGDNFEAVACPIRPINSTQAILDTTETFTAGQYNLTFVGVIAPGTVTGNGQQLLAVITAVGAGIVASITPTIAQMLGTVTATGAGVVALRTAGSAVVVTAGAVGMGATNITGGQLVATATGSGTGTATNAPAVAYNSQSAGNTVTSGNSITDAVTPVAGANIGILVAVGFSVPSPFLSSPIAMDTLTCTSDYGGGTTLTLLGTCPVGATGQKEGGVAVFLLQGAAAVQHNLIATVIKAGETWSELTIKAVAYTNAVSFGTPVTLDQNTLTALSVSVPTAIGSMAFCASVISNTPAGANNTVRAQLGAAVTGNADFLLVQDATGVNGSVVFTTTSANQRSGAVAVNINRT